MEICTHKNAVNNNVSKCTYRLSLNGGVKIQMHRMLTLIAHTSGMTWTRNQKKKNTEEMEKKATSKLQLDLLYLI